MRCLRFVKCVMVSYTMLILCIKFVIVVISKSSNFHVSTYLHIMPTSILIEKYMYMTCTRCQKFARFTQ
ncbi:hypothetical protein AHAS_Ahas15G0181800 [Arachis hypogaea]